MVGFSGRARPEDIKRLVAGTKRLARDYPQAMRNTLVRFGKEWDRDMVLRFKPYTGAIPSPADGLQNRTGTLKRSMGHKVTGSGLSSLRLRLTSGGTPYAKIHELGGTIKPKSAQFLTIPLPNALTPAGRQRFPSVRTLIKRHPKKTYWLRSKRGNLLLMAKEKIGASPAGPLYVFKRQVKIPPGRLGFFKTWNDLEGARRKQLQRIQRTGLRAAFRGFKNG